MKPAAEAAAPKLSEAAPAVAPAREAGVEVKPETKAEAKVEVKVEAKVEPKVEVKPEMKPEAAPSPAPETQSAVRPAEETPMPDMAKAGSEMPAPAGEPIASDNAATVSAIRDSEGLHVTFAFATETPAAMFRRADTVWLVFDTTKPLDLAPIQDSHLVPGMVASSHVADPGQLRTCHRYRFGHPARHVGMAVDDYDESCSFAIEPRPPRGGEG